MVDRSAIDAWASKHEVAIAQGDIAKAIRAAVANESLAEAALLHGATSIDPLGGLRRFLNQQINNKFMNVLFPQSTDVVESGPIKTELVENHSDAVGKTLSLKLEWAMRGDGKDYFKKIADDCDRDLYVTNGDNRYISISALDNGLKIETKTMDGLVSGYNEVASQLHGHAGTALPFDLIMLDRSDFKAAGQGR